MNWLRKLFEKVFLRPTPNASKAPPAPVASNARTTPPASGIPCTLEAGMTNSGVSRPKYFDPALRHFYKGFRAGEPQFNSKDVELLWQTNRSKVLHHILSLISVSDCAEHLVLRGSVLLRTWLGEKARLPGDLDWVVTPQSWSINEKSSKLLMERIVDLLRGASVEDSLHIPDTPFATDEIWTYEKAPGWRIIVPWRDDNPILNGTVQMDFVFGEFVPSEPQITNVVIGSLSSIPLRTATMEQSLAWKLLWLVTDCYAMGKDLYDAVLLAENSRISAQLLKRTFEVEETGHFSPYKNFTAEQVRNWRIEWDDFIKEYPTVPGAVDEWRERLVEALKPLFQEIEESRHDER